MDVHPTISKKLDELSGRAKELADAQRQNLDILVKTLELRDYRGFLSRVAEVTEFATKLSFCAAQIEILRSLPYDMAATDMAPRRVLGEEGSSPRRTTQRTAAFQTPEKKDG